MTSPNLEDQVNKWVAHPDQYYADFDKDQNLMIKKLGIFTGSKKVKSNSAKIATVLFTKELYFEKLITKLENEMTNKSDQMEKFAPIKAYVQAGRLHQIQERINNSNFAGAYEIFAKMTQDFQAEFMKSDSKLVDLLSKQLFGDPPQEKGFACKDNDIDSLSRFFLSQEPVLDPKTKKNLPPILSQVLSGNYSAQEKAYFLLPFYEQKPEGVYSIEMVKCLKELLSDQSVSSNDKANVLMRVGSKNLHVVELACATLSKDIDSSLQKAAQSNPNFFNKIKDWLETAVKNNYQGIFCLLVKNFSEHMFDKEVVSGQEKMSYLDYAIRKNDEFLDIILKNMPRQLLFEHINELKREDKQSSKQTRKMICDTMTTDYLAEWMQLENVNPEHNNEYQELLKELKIIPYEQFNQPGPFDDNLLTLLFPEMI
jgi:hypothetical protein